MKRRLLPLMFLALFLVTSGILAWGSLAASEALPVGSEPGETITLKIDGWTCASCEKDIKKALMGVAGVQSAEVRYAHGGAIVVVAPGQVHPDQLVQAVQSTGNVFDTYKATVIPNGTLSMNKNEGSAFQDFWSSLWKK
jgi:copper chaperone CopZ